MAATDKGEGPNGFSLRARRIGGSGGVSDITGVGELSVAAPASNSMRGGGAGQRDVPRDWKGRCTIIPPLAWRRKPTLPARLQLALMRIIQAADARPQL